MSLDPNTTTASIIATGVSLGCIDNRQKRWEAGFIGEDQHDMTIRIIKKAAGGDTVLREIPIAHGSKITVELVGGTALPSPGGSHQGNFNKIVDIDKKVHPKPLAKFKPPTRPITELRVVPAAKLYAHTSKLSRFPVRLVRKRDGHLIEKLGVIPTAAGTDITYREGRVVIKVTGPKNDEYPVPNEPGFRFEVWFDNACPPSNRPPEPEPAGEDFFEPAATEKLLLDNSVETVENHSDFVLNYHVLDVAEHERRDLRRDDDRRGQGAICNYSHLSGRSSMFPLPT